MNCESFRKRFAVSGEDPHVLAHLRACDRCLDFAAQEDPDVMFRALGVGEMVPPGGVDAFVGDVMQQVRVRAAEENTRPRNVVSWPRRLAIAATIAAGISGTMLFYKSDAPTGGAPSFSSPAPIRRAEALRSTSIATKPVVETYESQNATIVEMPGEEAGGDEVKIVMIFDENLPADL